MELSDFSLFEKTDNNISLWENIENIESFLLCLKQILWMDLFELLSKIEKLKKIDKTLCVYDFDDTLHTRYFQLQESMFLENRWEKWNKIIKKRYWWYEDFVEKYVFPWLLVKEITEMIKLKNWLILSAWTEELQKLKIYKSWLNDIPHFIVSKSYFKTFILLKIILNSWKIPKKIEIYDDIIKDFLKYIPILKDLLWVEISILKVWLKWIKLDTLEEYNFN